VLRYYEDLSEREIADALGCSPGSVKRHASRALAALRARLSDPVSLEGGAEHGRR
jgi:DNA-directed RNA polymerase specialized sigma24 family protein